jgi:hypothetical protein
MRWRVPDARAEGQTRQGPLYFLTGISKVRRDMSAPVPTRILAVTPCSHDEKRIDPRGSQPVVPAASGAARSTLRGRGLR